jgi:uncharacterized DUF497 family protein
MAEPRFEWDPRKSTLNQRKHGVSFDEARTAFADEHGLLLDDLDHSGTEQRFVLLGLSAAFRVLVVVHSYREDEDTIRIISARRATREERNQYHARWRS